MIRNDNPKVIEIILIPKENADKNIFVKSTNKLTVTSPKIKTRIFNRIDKVVERLR